MNELEWQARLCKRVTEEGGYGTKIDTKNLVGRPDVILATPEAGMFMAEVKWERGWNKNTPRTIAVTPRQTDEIELINKGGGLALILVIVSVVETGRHTSDHYVNLHKISTFDAPVYRNRILDADTVFEDYRCLVWKRSCRLREFINHRLEELT